MSVAEFEKEQLVAALLGCLVDSMGGIAEIDLPALEKFAAEGFYAVKLEFTDQKVVLEVINEDPAEAPASADSGKG